MFKYRRSIWGETGKGPEARTQGKKFASDGKHGDVNVGGMAVQRRGMRMGERENYQESREEGDVTRNVGGIVSGRK